MATVTYTIYSRYDPAQREALEHETGQIPAVEDSGDSFAAEATKAFQRRLAPPPQFVPATLSYDDMGESESASSRTQPAESNSSGNAVAGWYRSLTTKQPTAVGASQSLASTASSSTPNTDLQTLASNNKVFERRDKNNWFIMKAISSEPQQPPSQSSPSLADMLARNPPPLPNEQPYNPPVWLAIGPSNRGFTMLQQRGWNEGEPLGPDVVRRRPVADLMPGADLISVKGKGKARESPRTVKVYAHERKCGIDEVVEVRQVDAIDLTLSDSERSLDDSDNESDEAANEISIEPPTAITFHSTESHGRKALVTPIATVLKSDRLGIGLKAKTEGPYKASRKRITHNTAALSAHTKAAESLRKRQKEVGRGRRSFAREKKIEEASRKRLLAYLNE